MSGVTRRDKISNEHVRGSEQNVTELAKIIWASDEVTGKKSTKGGENPLTILILHYSNFYQSWKKFKLIHSNH